MISLRKTQQNINASLANTIFHCTVAFLKATNNATENNDDTAKEAHKIVNSILDQHHETLLKYCSPNTTLQAFRDGYKLIHSLDTLPNPINLQIALSPARRGRQNNPQQEIIGDSIGHALLRQTKSPPITHTNNNNNAQRTRTAEQTRVLNTKNLLENTLIRPFDIFLAQTDALTKAIAIKALEADLFTKAATDSAAMIVDNEPAPNPQQLQELITKSITKATKNLQNEINTLRAVLNNNPISSRNKHNQKDPRRQSSTRSKNNNKSCNNSPNPTRGRQTTCPKPKPCDRGASPKRNSATTNTNNNNHGHQPPTCRRSPKSQQAEESDNDTTDGNRKQSQPKRTTNSSRRSNTNGNNTKTSSNRQRRQSGRN
jgi:hypothetical protein